MYTYNHVFILAIYHRNKVMLLILPFSTVRGNRLRNFNCQYLNNLWTNSEKNYIIMTSLINTPVICKQKKVLSPNINIVAIFMFGTDQRHINRSMFIFDITSARF